MQLIQCLLGTGKHHPAQGIKEVMPAVQLDLYFLLQINAGFITLLKAFGGVILWYRDQRQVMVLEQAGIIMQLWPVLEAVKKLTCRSQWRECGR